ncbi:MAG TPA: sensor histidine kinase [Bacteroidetes bacterium]|nr:sensor histidine kinase [Bacteroidota bacterium]
MTLVRKGPTSDRIPILRTSVTKWQLKVLLTLFGFAIMGGVLYYTMNIVDELQKTERRTVELYAGLLARLSMAATEEDLLFYIDIQNNIHFPVILTDANEKPVYPFQQFMLNVELDSTLTVPEQRAELERTIAEMKSEYEPYDILNQDREVTQKLFYTNSAIVRRLRYMPFAEILAVSAFILIGYVAFSTIRRNEESNIWVGMAKEAAHQLGTPLSSLLAWIEILRLNDANPDMVRSTADEMTRDIERLNIIAIRFSKIGSQPKLEQTNVADVLDHVVTYFETRLPHLGRKVVIHRQLDRTVECPLNIDLFEWVIENLIKNAVEAIERPDGRIDIVLRRRQKGGTLVSITDNGKGMTSHVRKNIFEPGYTTKKRGWGLGLSLSRRIVEDYHGGKIYVKESQPGVGTTFRIELP